MSVYDITRRQAQRPAFCRGCDSTIKKDEDMIATYSFRNTGQHIYFCIPCGQAIGALANKENEE